MSKECYQELDPSRLRANKMSLLTTLTQKSSNHWFFFLNLHLLMSLVALEFVWGDLLGLLVSGRVAYLRVLNVGGGGGGGRYKSHFPAQIPLSSLFLSKPQSQSHFHFIVCGSQSQWPISHFPGYMEWEKLEKWTFYNKSRLSVLWQAEAVCSNVFSYKLSHLNQTAEVVFLVPIWCLL